MTRASRRIVAVAVALGLLGSAACHRGGGYVWVQQDRYIPSLPASLQAYQGYPVGLEPFVNAAPETERDYYYYSADRSVTYEGSPTLSTYLHDAFVKALTSLGMNVIVQTGSPVASGAPDLQVTIVSWTDAQLYYQVVVSKNLQPVYQQEYRIEVPPMGTTDSKLLEDRSYRIIDMAVTGMLADQGFQAAFFQ